MICPFCKKETPRLTGSSIDGTVIYRCKFCIHTGNKLPSVVNCDNFTPHYDVQVDAYIESKEHKDMLLKKKGLKQTEGTVSPRRTEGKGRIVCTKDQYKSAVNKRIL